MKHQSVLLRSVFSLVILVYLLSIIDLKALFVAIKDVHIFLALMVTLSVLLDRAFMAFKWNLLVRVQGIQISFKECFRVYLVGSFIGMFFPTSVGGDVVRLFSVGVEKGKRGAIAASIVVERLVAFIALILLFFLATVVLLFFSTQGTKPYFWLALGLLVISTGLFILSFYFLPVAFIKKYESGFLGKIRQIIEAYDLFRKEHKVLAVFFVLSFLEHGVPILGNFLTAKALGIQVNPLAFFLMVPVILICARLPISLDGLGVQEALYVVLFPLAGLSKTDAFSIGVMIRFLTIIAMLPGAWLFMFSKKRDVQTLNIQ